MDSANSIPVLSSVKGQQLVSSQGIVSYHGYTPLRYRHFPKHNIKLLEIRNTWGDTEWNGAFSDYSMEWKKYPEIASELEHKAENDGCFWMTYSDFLKYYCVLWWNEH